MWYQEKYHFHLKSTICEWWYFKNCYASVALNKISRGFFKENFLHVTMINIYSSKLTNFESLFCHMPEEAFRRGSKNILLKWSEQSFILLRCYNESQKSVLRSSSGKRYKTYVSISTEW